MKKEMIKLAFAVCVVGVSLSSEGQRQGQGIRQFVQDVQAAIPRATLNDDQKSQLQSDLDGINAALQARQQGQAVDRDKLKAAVTDIHQIVDGGGFQPNDQKKLDQEFQAMNSR